METVTPAAAVKPFSLEEILVVVQWGISPVNLIHWTLALGTPASRVSVLCALDMHRDAPARLPKGRTQAMHVKWRPAWSHLIEETVAQLTAAGLHAEAVYRNGRPAEVVLWAAKTHGADLVIATAAFADQIHAESLTRIKRTVPASLLFVRSDPDIRPILLADDFTKTSRRARLFAAYLAERLNVPIHVTSDERVGPADRFLAKPPGPRREAMVVDDALRTRPPGTAVADHILRSAEERNAQLVIVGSHRRGSLGRFLLGSVSDDVARRARTNVLVAVPSTY